MYLSLSLSLSLSLWLSFCWSGHVFSSPWSNVSKVKSLKDCSLKVFSKCICHCLCICLCSLSLSFCWSGHVFAWPPSILQGFGLVWKAGRLWIQHNQWVSEWVTRVGLEMLGQLKINKKVPARCSMSSDTRAQRSWITFECRTWSQLSADVQEEHQGQLLMIVLERRDTVL